MVIRSNWKRVRFTLALCGAFLALRAAWAQPVQDPSQLALLTEISGVIGPSTSKQVSDALDTARDRHAGAVILQLDTPGGLSDSMREIISDILASDIPVIGYVAPPGAHAASAGTYILYATSLAAMAPGTNLRAATPIQIGGIPGLPSGDDQPGQETPKDGAGHSTLENKMINDAVAQIRSLADIHGRNADWAEKAVREAATLTANEAKALNVVELIATDVPDLLAQADGRAVITGSGQQLLHTGTMRVERIEPSFTVRLLSIISNPNVAFILMLFGVYGLVFEFAHPGTIGPGVIGAICLVLGLYALNQLPLDYAGLALLLLGLAMMITEAVTPSFGIIGLGGLVAFIIGAAMLVDSDQPEFRLSWSVIGATAAFSAALLVMLLGYVWRSQRSKVVTGREELHNAEARVIEWADGTGAVHVRGERWQARGPAGLKVGDKVHIAEIDGLTLVITP